jgi:hypothetical protein
MSRPRVDYKGRAEALDCQREFEVEAKSKSLEEHRKEFDEITAELRACPPECTNVQSMLCHDRAHKKQIIKYLEKSCE